MKRILCMTLCCFSFTLLPVPAGAQGYPPRPVKMVVGFSPGGGTDILARIVAQKQGSLQHIAAELFKLRAIAVTASKRAAGLPELPSIAEGGYADYDLTTWWGIFAPAGTPPEIVAKVHRDTLAALGNPELKERFAGLSVDPGGGSSRDFADYVQQEIAKYDKLVKELNIKSE